MSVLNTLSDIPRSLYLNHKICYCASTFQTGDYHTIFGFSFKYDHTVL